MATTSTLPFLNKSFTQLSAIGKMIYGASALATLAGGMLVIVQASAFAGEKIDENVVSLINEHAYEAIQQQVSGDFEKLHNGQERSRLMQQISLNRMEMRFIESEIKTITREAGESLTLTEAADIDQLRDDRNALKEEITNLTDELHNIGQ